jgi:hypothetical protein
VTSRVQFDEPPGYLRPAEAVAECDDEAMLESFIARAEPCVVRGFAARWPALERWTLPALASKGRGRTAEVAPLDRGFLGTQARFGVSMRPCEMGGFVERLAAGDESSYLMTRLDALESLGADTLRPRATLGASWRDSKIWISPRGAVSPLHFDIAHNLHVQVAGRKRFLLLPARDAIRLYPFAPWSGTPNFSHVDPMQPDLARYPRARGVTRWLAELLPGDAVFIPGFVWHHVTSVEVSVSVNFWWARGVRSLVARSADAWKRFRAVSR